VNVLISYDSTVVQVGVNDFICELRILRLAAFEKLKSKATAINSRVTLNKGKVQVLNFIYSEFIKLFNYLRLPDSREIF